MIENVNLLVEIRLGVLAQRLTYGHASIVHESVNFHILQRLGQFVLHRRPIAQIHLDDVDFGASRFQLVQGIDRPADCVDNNTDSV